MQVLVPAIASLILAILGYTTVTAKHISVHKVVELKLLPRAHDSPEGRVVTQGLAAMSGFTLGLTKALAGVFIYDIITANVTLNDLVDATSASTGSTASTTVTGKLTGKTREICFNSENTRKDTAKGRSRRRGRAKSRNSKRNSYVATRTGTGSSETLTSPTYPTQATNPTMLTTGTNTGTSVDEGSGTGTFTESFTSTGNEGSINCIVVPVNQ